MVQSRVNRPRVWTLWATSSRSGARCVGEDDISAGFELVQIPDGSGVVEVVGFQGGLVDADGASMRLVTPWMEETR